LTYIQLEQACGVLGKQQTENSKTALTQQFGIYNDPRSLAFARHPEKFRMNRTALSGWYDPAVPKSSPLGFITS